jgi:hypothetical protein
LSFRIAYHGAPAPQRHATHALRSAMYDHADAGPSATVKIDGYALVLRGTGLIELVDGALDVAEHLHSPGAGESEEGFRELLPAIPPRSRVHSITFPYYMHRIPTIVFAADGDSVWIYTRTYEAATLVVDPGRDRAEPIEVARGPVLAELRSFLERYFSDLGAALPLVREDDSYREHVQRIQRL